MRWTVFLLILFSFNVYSRGYNPGGPNIPPCLPSDISDWGEFEYVMCPTLTTIVIPLAIIVAPTGTTFYIGSSSDKKNKLIINSKIHAASYVASNGEINSAYLEQALLLLRIKYPNSSDMELAKAILAY